MRSRFADRAMHALMAFLLAAGTLMPLLGVLFPGFSSLSPLLWAAALILLLEAASFHRISAIAAAILLGLSALLFCLSPGGFTRVQDVLIAVSLRLRGQSYALPLVQADCVVFLSLVLSILSFLAVLRQASFLPSAMLCAAGMLLLWLSDSPALIPWWLPSMVPVFLLVISGRHEQTSLWRVLPGTVLLILAAFLLSPDSGITFRPAEEKANDLRQAIMDRLFFTDPRDVFSLSSEGYYPQGSSQLGGKPELSDHPVLQVSSPQPVYLRGVVLNRYDGHTWRNTTGGRRYLWQSSQTAASRAGIFDENLPAVSSDNALLSSGRVSVRMLSDSASTLFVPQRIRELLPGGEIVPYFSEASEVFITRNLQAGDSYAVSAPLFRAGDPGIGTLIGASSALGDAAWSNVTENYLQLPSHLEKPLFDLAQEIVAGISAPYEKAFAIQAWLSRNCRYTLDVPDHPADEDFVTRFLLNTREGYCTYFASAMTILCRMAGLPSRYVEGYLAEPDSSGQAVVTGLNAHAWTEVCFQGFGWLTFDATPRRTTQESSGDSAFSDTPSPSPEPPEFTEPIPSAAPEAAESSVPDADPEPPVSVHPSYPVLWLLLLLLLGALLLRILLTSPRFRIQKASRKLRVDSRHFREAVIDIWSDELASELSAEGFVRSTGETLMAFSDRVDRTARFGISFVPVGECLSVLRYSPADCTDQDTALLEASARSLRRELSGPARLRYWLSRLFLLKRKEL